MIRYAMPAACVAILLFGGCTVGPRYVRPTPILLGSLSNPNALAAATPLSRLDETAVDLSDWWSQLGDPTLDALVARARTSNLDRKTAASRVREARAAAAQSRSALFPTLAGGANYYHARLSENAIPSALSSSIVSGGGGGGATTSESGTGSSGGIPAIETDIYVAGIQGSYTLDLFGANRSALRSARARTEAEIWSERDTEVTVVSEVARAYLGLRAGQARVAVLKSNARSQGELLAILNARARGGLVNEVDAARQRSQLALVQAQIPPVEAEVATDVHQIGLLLGLAPDSLADELAQRSDPLAALPAILPRVPVGLPSTLLQRRPDIRRAERLLAASVSDVDQATAQLYPQIQLTGIGDLVSSSLRNLLDWGSRTLLGGISLAQPLFDGGGRLARKHQTEERSTQSEIAYERSVLNALGQTADALDRYGADQRQLVVLRSGYAAARRAAELDRAQYLGGVADLTSTLQAETVAAQTQDQLIRAQGQLFIDLVALYRSLGGGWTNDTRRDRAAIAIHSPIMGTKNAR